MAEVHWKIQCGFVVLDVAPDLETEHADAKAINFAAKKLAKPANEQQVWVGKHKDGELPNAQ